MQIERTGRVTFGDARLSVWEDDIPRKWDAKEVWECEFKKQVFKRIIQQLNRIGWTCKMPDIEAREIKQYGGKVAVWAAQRKRLCNKGDLHADLIISGRCIEFNMFQNVNAPDRPDHGGRYQSDKEKNMPYLIRLEMERTRRRIRKYLCSVFTGYEFQPKKSPGWSAIGPRGMTNLEWLAANYQEHWHFKGDTSTYEISDYNSNSADGKIIQHLQRVWYTDRHGRMRTGIAHYNINNMWWILSGKFGITNEASHNIYAQLPENLRLKRNDRQRRSRLEGLLADAIKVMDFRRAEVLKNLTFKPDEPLFLLWNDEHKLYHRAGFNGYTKDVVYAGKFTADEVKNWGNDSINRVIPMTEAA